MLRLKPDLISRAQADRLLSSSDPACWPDEAHSPFWHNEVAPRVGGRLFLCVRLSDGEGWFWAKVHTVLRWQVAVEMSGAGPPGSGLVRGHTFMLDHEELAHVTLADAPAEAAYAAWYRAWRVQTPRPDAASTKESRSEL